MDLENALHFRGFGVSLYAAAGAAAARARARPDAELVLALPIVDVLDAGDHTDAAEEELV